MGAVLHIEKPGSTVAAERDNPNAVYDGIGRYRLLDGQHDGH